MTKWNVNTAIEISKTCKATGIEAIKINAITGECRFTHKIPNWLYSMIRENGGKVTV